MLEEPFSTTKEYFFIDSFSCLTKADADGSEQNYLEEWFLSLSKGAFTRNFDCLQLHWAKAQENRSMLFYLIMKESVFMVYRTVREVFKRKRRFLSTFPATLTKPSDRNA